MTQIVSTPQPLTRTSGSASRLAQAVVVSGAAFGVVLLVAALVLWMRYGTTVFFEMIASGLAACF